MDSSDSAEPMKVPENLVIPKVFLTTRAGVLEQQEPDRDLAPYRRDTAFGGSIPF